MPKKKKKRQILAHDINVSIKQKNKQIYIDSTDISMQTDQAHTMRPQA